MLMGKFYALLADLMKKKDGRVNKPNDKIFQLDFTSFSFIVVGKYFCSKILYVR